MAQRRTTGAAPRTLLLRGRRLETAGQTEDFVEDAVGLHLLGQDPYVNEDDLVDALNAAVPNGKTWNRQRLGYLKGEIRKKMAAQQRRPAVRCPAEGSPPDTHVTEGFGVGNGADSALNMDMFYTNVNEPPAAAAAEGVPNNTGLLQAAHIENNGIFKIKWVQSTRILLRLEREDFMKPKEEGPIMR